ncbi:PRC-barrel domain-containing protein [Kitasatospora sp. NPDC006697]|uniref:PRC-barrel domain-containing protein n=1 Tax=Kitasatospora sp. NPDC006697 TaxID=3364020 RepID=UPI00369CA22D
MNTSVPYRIGDFVQCADGEGGPLDRVVIDPVAGRVTHLVVADRLVPVELVVDAPEAQAGGILLRCDRAELERQAPAEETSYLRPETDPEGYARDEALLLPYYGLGAGGVGLTPNMLLPTGEPEVEVHERVPAGEVQIRHGDRVEATDGSVGKVQGLVVDPDDHSVSHILLQEGHLWGRKTVAIPLRVTDWIGGRVNVHLTKAELADLPEASFG